MFIFSIGTNKYKCEINKINRDAFKHTSIAFVRVLMSIL